MQTVTADGRNLINHLSGRYNISPDAVMHMIVAVNNGGGSMAQFNCPELGGGGQWMRGGMTMVGDMFNYGLKATVDNLCSEIANALATTQVFPIIPPGTPGSNQWWPGNLGQPFSSGAQNNIRYAIFPQRLAVELNGQVTVYDTLDHQIGGVSQQQGGDTSLTFSSQYGNVSVSSLPIISGNPIAPPQNNFAAPPPAPPVAPTSNNNVEGAINSGQGTSSAPSADHNQVLALIEGLAKLLQAGVLSQAEFEAKKAELLSRL